MPRRLKHVKKTHKLSTWLHCMCPGRVKKSNSPRKCQPQDCKASSFSASGRARACADAQLVILQRVSPPCFPDWLDHIHTPEELVGYPSRIVQAWVIGRDGWKIDQGKEEKSEEENLVLSVFIWLLLMPTHCSSLTGNKFYYLASDEWVNYYIHSRFMSMCWQVTSESRTNRPHYQMSQDIIKDCQSYIVLSLATGMPSNCKATVRVITDSCKVFSCISDRFFADNKQSLLW